MTIRQTLVAITVESTEVAQQLLHDLRDYDRNNNNMVILDAVYATKDSNSNMKINQTGDLEGGQGALGGGVVGLIAGGLVFGPIGAAIGTALGGVLAGVYSSLRDSGMNNRVMKNIVRDMEINQTTLILLYEGTMHPSMNTLFANHNARLFYTNLPVGAADTVRAVLSSTNGTQAVSDLNNYSVGTQELTSAYERETPQYVVDNEDRVSGTTTGDALPVVPIIPTPGVMSGGMIAPAVIPAMAEAMAQTPPVSSSSDYTETSSVTTDGYRADAAQTGSSVGSSDNVVHLKSDDLKQISGVDTQIEQVLRDNNIKTFVQLSHASTSELRNILTRVGIVQPPSISTWTEQAWLAAQGKQDELHDLQSSLKN